MRRWTKALCLVMALLIVAASRAGEPKPKPTTKISGATEGESVTAKLQPHHNIIGKVVGYYRPQRIELSEKRPEGIKKEPVFKAKKPLYGTLEAGTGPHNKIALAVDEGDEENPRIYVDRNHDGDLTNDGPGAWSKTAGPILMLNDVAIDVPYGSGKSVPYSFNFYRFKNRLREFVLYFRNSDREGEIELDGKQYKIALLDDNGDGRFDDLEGDTLLVDLNRDGKLEGDPDSAEWYSLEEPFNVHGKVWEAVSVSPDGLSITLRRSKADVPEKAYLDPGSPAPTFTAKGLEGEKIDLKAQQGKAKYVLLDFWASWCGPCRAEFPTMRKLYAQYKNHGLQILGVNLDEERDAAVNATKDAHLGYPHAFDGKGWQNHVAVLYRVHGIPQTYLLDKDLKIVAKGLRGEDLQARLEKLLGEGDKGAAEAIEKEVQERAKKAAEEKPEKEK